ncbi:MAG: DUF1275 domain-containing protein [Clostridiales bacterium]|nr:DUF1275 domain-containing protein [Clostridiales bacterium]
MKHNRQMSESLELGIVLALAGGFMDAYSYMCREQVFANAQTGNMLLFGIRLSEGDWEQAIRYLIPVLAFAMGIAIADMVKLQKKELSLLHWRQISVLCEAVIFGIVCLMPQSMNLPANSLTSLACGIQVESFRKIQGNGIATTMCIGNLRSAVQNTCDYLAKRDREAAGKGMLYYLIIAFFILGAVIGHEAVKYLAERAILICSGILLAAFFMMFSDWEKKQ